MRLHSLISVAGRLVPVEVELGLLPGLPQLHIIGLPDQGVRESAIKIRSALKNAGYRWPLAKQIIVSLRPSHLKKTSLGLELAIAAGILYLTKQVELVPRWNISDTSRLFFYGEMDLQGRVLPPPRFFFPQGLGPSDVFVTGKSEQPLTNTEPCTIFSIAHLRELARPQEIRAQSHHTFSRPEMASHLRFTKSQATLIQALVLGEFHSLFAGPAATGKTFLSEVIHSLRMVPKAPEGHEIHRRQLETQSRPGVPTDALTEGAGPSSWRPYLRPHHSLTLQGLLGGGSSTQMCPGELYRAHEGTLCLDELLEFRTEVMESLREPMESGEVRLARAQDLLNYESRVQIIATTNLCPCGDYIPGAPTAVTARTCRYSSHRCKSYAQKLSGPLVDRFEVIAYSQNWRRDLSEISWQTLSSQIDATTQWAESEGVPLGKKLRDRHVEETAGLSAWPFLARKLVQGMAHESRRYRATLRMSQVLAMIDHCKIVQHKHVEHALHFTKIPFEKLKRWD